MREDNTPLAAAFVPDPRIGEPAEETFAVVEARKLDGHAGGCASAQAANVRRADDVDRLKREQARFRGGEIVGLGQPIAGRIGEAEFVVEQRVERATSPARMAARSAASASAILSSCMVAPRGMLLAKR